MADERYRASWLKIERAKEHIENINAILTTFLHSDFYGISVEKNIYGANYLKCEIDTSKFSSDRCALIIGDALHNLRSALDLFYSVSALDSTGWTSFPISNTREKLIPRLDQGLKKKQISPTLYEFILNTVKPYMAGNYFLWTLNHLNNWDKHQLLVPVIQGMEFHDVRLEDDKNNPVNWPSFYYIPHSWHFPLSGTEGRKVTLKGKGYATATIFFNFESGILNQDVIKTLGWIAEEITRTIKAFELL